jgi:PAS domain S-box-containing protein
MNSVANIASEPAATRADLNGRLSLFASPWPVVIAMVVTSAGYYAGARLGFALRFPESPHSVLWPPNAILLAALLLMPQRLWWWSLAAVLPAHVAICLPAGLPWVTLLGLYLTNILQALLGAVLIRRLARQYENAGTRVWVIVFIVYGVFVSPLVLSFADVAVAVLTRWTSNPFWQAWPLRFLSNAASVVIFVPPILTIAHALRTWRKPRTWRLIEAFSLALCFSALGSLIVLRAPASGGMLPLVVCGFLPLLLWAATRFGQAGASWALLGIVAVTIVGLGHWPALVVEQAEILMLQSVFLLVSLPVLYLAALNDDLLRYVRTLDTTTERFHMATAAGGIGVWDWNPKSGDLFIHEQLKKALGYEDREIANHVDAWMQHYHPGDRERVLRIGRACARGEADGFEDEHRMRHADGSMRWFLSRGALVRDKAGQPARVIGTCIDVTERRRIADELRRLETLWSAVLASLSEHVAIIDRDGAILAVNEPWTRFTRENERARLHAPVGANYLEVCRDASNEPDSSRIAGEIAAVLAGTQSEFRMEYACPSGTGTQWFEMSALPLRRPDGGGVVLHSDISRRKQAELDSELQRQELTHLTRVGILGELSGALAHELNQPLTAILSNAQAVQRLLLREPLDMEELSTALQDIVDADRRAGAVIHRLHALLKKGEPQFRPLDVNAIVAEVLDLAHSDFIAREVTVASRPRLDLPVVRGDRVQLQQLLLNLIINACEAMVAIDPKERVLTVMTAFGDDRTVEIAVLDRGTGIPADLQGRLFEPFITTKKHGLGLGLSICRSIVAAHGGRMWAVNNPERGTTFFVSLPYDAEAAA